MTSNIFAVRLYQYLQVFLQTVSIPSYIYLQLDYINTSKHNVSLPSSTFAVRLYRYLQVCSPICCWTSASFSSSLLLQCHRQCDIFERQSQSAIRGEAVVLAISRGP